MRNPSSLVAMLRDFLSFRVSSFRSFISATERTEHREKLKEKEFKLKTYFFCFISRLLLPFNHIQNFQCSFFTLQHADSLVWSFYCCSFRLSHFSLPFYHHPYPTTPMLACEREFQDFSTIWRIRRRLRTWLNQSCMKKCLPTSNTIWTIAEEQRKRTNGMKNIQRLNSVQKIEMW